MLALSVQLYLLKVTLLPSFAIWHGPSSKRRPVEEEHPGPPFNLHRRRGPTKVSARTRGGSGARRGGSHQSTRGSLEGEPRDSKAQKKLEREQSETVGETRDGGDGNAQVSLGVDVKVARVGLDGVVAKSRLLWGLRRNVTLVSAIVHS